MADSVLTSRSAVRSVEHSAKTSEEIVQENDLLPKLMPYLDRHMIFPLLEFFASQDGTSAEEITKAKYELLKQTNMTDYVASLWKDIHKTNNVPDEFTKKKEDVLQKLEVFVEESSKITELLGREDVVSGLRSDKVANLQFLKEQHEVRMLPLRTQRHFSKVDA
jgi:translation initiation factor 3 subunit E